MRCAVVGAEKVRTGGVGAGARGLCGRGYCSPSLDCPRVTMGPSWSDDGPRRETGAGAVGAERGPRRVKRSAGSATQKARQMCAFRTTQVRCVRAGRGGKIAWRSRAALANASVLADMGPRRRLLARPCMVASECVWLQLRSCLNPAIRITE
eukprot:1225717-Rhodomonas_salina.3